MTRPPHARQKILDSAEALVAQHGAAKLTFDALVAHSGVTRGGITYHFPTKQALLEALVEHQLSLWERSLNDCAKRWPNEPAARLKAYVAADADPSEDDQRLAAGLISAGIEAPALNDPWRRHFAQWLAWSERSADPELALIILLAADGLFWSDHLRLWPMEPAQRQKLVSRLLELADTLNRPDHQVQPGNPQ